MSLLRFPFEHLPLKGEALLRCAESVLFAGVRVAPFDVQRLMLEKLLHEAYPEALQDDAFAALRGRWLRIDVIDGPGWNVTMGRDRLIVTAGDVCADVRIAASFEDFVLLASQQADPDTLFFQRRLKIEGNTELGLVVKNLIFGSELAGMPARILEWLVAFRAGALATTDQRVAAGTARERARFSRTLQPSRVSALRQAGMRPGAMPASPNQ